MACSEMGTRPARGLVVDVRQACEAEVGEPPNYWHWHQCHNAAKFHVLDAAGRARYVCGVHKRGPQRLVGDGFVKRGAEVEPIAALASPTAREQAAPRSDIRPSDRGADTPEGS